VALGGQRPRELLGALLLHPNRTVSSDRLVQLLWGEAAGDGAGVTLRTHVSHLRRALAEAGAPNALVTRPGGYVLAVQPGELDADVFERLVRRAQEECGLTHVNEAAELAEAALALWRGDVLADLGPPEHAAAAAAGLGELRMVAEETLVSAELARGRHLEVTGRLRRLVAEHPFRERFAAQLMLALYRAGRQAEALSAYAVVRDRLSEELGLDPGEELRSLETAVLRQDPELLMTSAAPGGSHGAAGGFRAPERQPLDAVLSALERTPLVGRGIEVSRLAAVWEDVAHGGSAVVTLSGPAGVGKSRLVARLAHEAVLSEATVLVGRCDDPPAPYAALGGALADSVTVHAILDEAPASVRDRLRPVLPALQPSDAVPPACAHAEPGERAAMLGAVHWLVGALAAGAPVLLVVEDAERLDDGTSALLRHLVRHLPVRVMLVLGYRDPPGTRHPPLLELLGDRDVRELAERVELRDLDREALRELVAAETGHLPPPATVDALWARTGGNPFFAREVLRDHDLTELNAGRVREDVPAGVRDVLRLRMRALPAHTREVLGAAALLGREVELWRLSVLLDRPEDELVTALEPAMAAGFLVEGGRTWAGAHAFVHDLTREVVRGDIPEHRRQRLHARAADVLLSGAATDADVLAAAAHLLAAGPAAEPREAADVVQRAADVAAAGWAYDEAVRLAEARLEVLRRFAERRTLAEAQVEVARLRLRAGRGYERAVELLEEALDSFLAMRDLAAAGAVHSRIGGILALPHSVMDLVRAGDHLAAAGRLLEDPGEVFHYQRARMYAAMYALDAAGLAEAAEGCAALATRLDRADLRTFADWGAAWNALHTGRPDVALELLEGAWQASSDRGDPLLGWPPANAAALMCTVYLLDPEAGRTWCRRALAHPRFDRLPNAHAAVLDQLVLALAESGELSAARRAAEELPPEAVGRRLVRYLDGEWEQATADWEQAWTRDLRAGDRHDAVLNARWLGEALLTRGLLSQGVAVLERALRIAVTGPDVPSELWLRMRLAASGVLDLDTAQDHLDRSARLLDGSEVWGGLHGELALAVAAVHDRRGEIDQAVPAAQEAVELFATRHLRWRQVAALRVQARLLGRLGKDGDARVRLGWADDLLLGMGASRRWFDLEAARPSTGAQRERHNLGTLSTP
jgi:DNA-binding SARP family transcriptional activator/tetratricopeptide (TPR) repeat protein